MTEFLTKSLSLRGGQGAKVLIEKSDPTINHKKYDVGTIWVNILSNSAYILVDNRTTGSWKEITSLNITDFTEINETTLVQGDFTLLNISLIEGASLSVFGILTGKGFPSCNLITAKVLIAARRLPGNDIEILNFPILDVISSDLAIVDFDIETDILAQSVNFIGTNNLNEEFKWNFKFIATQITV